MRAELSFLVDSGLSCIVEGPCRCCPFGPKPTPTYYSCLHSYFPSSQYTTCESSEQSSLMLSSTCARYSHYARIWTGFGVPRPRLETCQKPLQTTLRLQHPGQPPRAFATLSPRSQHIQLRPYQEDSIQSVLNHLKNGEKRLGISLATGSGKTVIFSHLLDRISAPTPKATRTLILAHRRELVDQAARHCRELYPDRSVEVEMGASRASGTADITVASVQSITSADRLMKYDSTRFKLVLVDEAHHIVARTYLDVLEHFGLAQKDSSNRGQCALVGVSATFSRQDGLRLGAAIDRIVYHKDYVDMIEDKWLAAARFTTVHTGTDLSKVRRSGGDFQTTSLSKAINLPATNELVVRSWLEVARERGSTLAFCVDVAHVSALTATFRAQGVDARFVTSDTQLKVRAERIAAFKAGEYPVLLNCGIFTEGTDIPNIDCVLLARPTQSRNLLVQMIGRGLRQSQGKQDCHVVDMVASLETGIVTVPTLFGLDPQELVRGVDAEAMKDLKERREREREALEQMPINSSTRPPSLLDADADVIFNHYEDVNDLIASTSGERHVRQLSQFSWVRVAEDRYILADIKGSFLALKRQDESFAVILTRKLPAFLHEDSKTKRGPFARPSEIATAESLETAVRAADTYAKEHFNRTWILTRASWRRASASETQVDFLNRSRAEDAKLSVGEVSKGRAADMITKLKHGAKGTASKAKAQRGRVEREKRRREEWRERQARAQVRVGPIAG